MNNGRITRLRNWLVVLATVVVFLGVAIPVMVIWVQSSALAEAQLAVVCEIRQVQATTHQELEDIRMTLGLPPGPQIGGVPPECGP